MFKFISFMYLFLETLELLKSAIHAVLLDEGFDVPSTPAQKATETAKCVLRWCEDVENIEVLECFADELVHLLQSCFQPRSTTNQVQSKERKDVECTSSTPQFGYVQNIVVKFSEESRV